MRDLRALLFALGEHVAEALQQVRGDLLSSASIGSLVISSTRMRVSAVTVALRGAPVISDISPKTSPAASTATSRGVAALTEHADARRTFQDDEHGRARIALLHEIDAARDFQAAAALGQLLGLLFVQDIGEQVGVAKRAANFFFAQQQFEIGRLGEFDLRDRRAACGSAG